MIRYNTSLSSFEGYGAAWASLGGVKSVDGNTYILAEATVGAGDNTLWFYNNATNTARLSTANLTLLQTTTSTSTTTGALQVAGGVGIAGNLYVGSNLIVPVGTTDQRGSVQGAIRYNTTTSAFESYDGATWNKLAYGTGGDFPTGDFGDLTTLTDAFGVATSTTYDCNAAGTVITSDLETAGTASLAPI
jgi:YD repeat-containing protein